jgi:hypothetical protein
MTRIRVPSDITGCWVTQSSAAMTWLTSVLPSVVASLSDSSSASGATPSSVEGDSRAIVLRSRVTGSRAAMIPAMCVPCPLVSSSVRSGLFASIERSGP